MAFLGVEVAAGGELTLLWLIKRHFNLSVRGWLNAKRSRQRAEVPA